MRRATAPLMPALLAGLLIAGCLSSPGSGTLTADWVALTSCEEDGDATVIAPLSIDLDFFALERSGGRGRIRLQRSGRPMSESDGIIVDIPDIEGMAKRMGFGLFSLNLGNEPNDIRAELYLLRTCDGTPPLSIVDGTLHFDHFEPDPHGLMQGHIEGRVADRRSDATVADALRATFDFTVRLGPPYQSFAPF